MNNLIYPLYNKRIVKYFSTFETINKTRALIFNMCKSYLMVMLTSQSTNMSKKIIWESEQRGEKFPGIDIYQAVIDEGIETFEGFKTWNSNRKRDTISMWEPNVENIKTY